ncbi:MAG: transcriptional repressor [Rubrivivax sp.]|nr:MAG: transcriptional repressor [Rubrivivax sp.]
MSKRAPGPHPAAPASGSSLDERLLAAKLRVTDARRTALGLLMQAQRALSHADIESMLDEPMDRVTLYRTLDRLAEAGLLHKTVGDDRITRFAPLGDAPDHHEHAHFHCDDCGRVFCLPQKVPRKPALPEGFAIESTELSWHGHCAQCTQPAAQKPSAGAKH